jgi:hypothetical protein
MVAPFLLLALALGLARWGAPRLADPLLRRGAQGLAVITAAVGLILLLRAPWAGLSWPGYRPRPWSSVGGGS